MPSKKSFSQKAAEAFFGGGSSSSSESEPETIPRPPPQKLKNKKLENKVKIEPGTEVSKKKKKNRDQKAKKTERHIRTTSAFRTSRADVLPDAVAKHVCFLVGCKRASINQIKAICKELIDEITSEEAHMAVHNMLFHKRRTLTSKDTRGRRTLIHD